MSEMPKGWAKLKLLLVPEIAFGYFLLGLILWLGGLDWGAALAGAGLVAIFSIDLFGLED